MEGVTEESREQSEKVQDETGPALADDTLQVGKDDVDVPAVTDPGEDETEPPPDWLEPLEDCEDEGDEGVEIDREGSSKGRSKRGKNAARRRGRPSVSSNSTWVDCPDLGSGWKRKVIYWRAGKSATYYLSPKGVRFRSKVQLAKHLKADLALFDYKEGKFVDAIIPRKRRKARVKEGTRRSRLSSSRTTTPDLAEAQNSDNLSTPIQNGPLSPQRPQLIPISLSISPPLKSAYRSPPDLTPVSPTIIQQPSPSPSLKLDDLEVQTNPVSQSWLQSSLAPVSPIKTSESDFPTYPNGQSDLLPTSLTQQDPEGGIKDHGLPPLEGCANCGCKYPGMGSGKQLLCRKCRPRRNQHPHIIFRKVGQDRWILGNSKNDISLKKKIPPLGKRRHPPKSLRLMAQQETEKEEIQKEAQQDSDEDDDGPDGGPDDDDDCGPRKRKRRMCGQCKACLRNENCGKCDFCLDKTRYGGPNKLRQKCRFRQCQVRSRLQTGSLKYARSVDLADSGQGEPSRKHGRHWGRRKMKRRSRSSKYCTDDENDDDGRYGGRSPGRKGRKGRPKKYGRRLKRVKDEEEDKGSDPEIEDDGPGDLIQDPCVVCDDGSSGFYESEELYSNNYIQNGPNLDMLRCSGPQAVEVDFPELPQAPGLVYAVPGLPDGSQLLSSVLPNGVPLQLSAVPGTHTPLMLDEVLGKAAPHQHPEVLTSNGPPVRLSDFLRNHGLELVEVDTTVPQMVPAPPTAPPIAPLIAPPTALPTAPPIASSTASLITPPSLEPEHQGGPGTLGASPETYSLPEPSESSSIRDSALLELLTSLRRTILPAHWVGVMANGPILQLFQCSKLSPMADTVLQIEPDFFYQISVQSQPLLPTHALYERHPARLTSVSKVVTLLLDLEELNVCQGYQSFEANSQQEPLLCARAALCQLLVPQDEDCCEKCQECNPLIKS
ncbi:methyl-CpG-binding domain protein 1a isoform X3 [Tachysurus fulvidraco]|uniref:methyl-CpG-binding domain protein 1a isoform X3 n=1 Tax=Tachysurus fulvidraco TaxID=1234273 RepID=UPI000F51403E|nr:methyl-CpG-binding domain protein 1a isoform X3 [Tachysurus fulvidraco]